MSAVVAVESAAAAVVVQNRRIIMAAGGLASEVAAGVLCSLRKRGAREAMHRGG